jgi:hypothetical protein
MQLVRGLLRYNDFASRAFHLDDSSFTEYRVRFKKNLCLFFRALHFFEEFHCYRGFPQREGFWGLIQQEAWFLFEKPDGPLRFLWFLIDSKAAFGNNHPYTAIPDSHYPQYIHRLVRHWSSMIRKSREADSRQKPTLNANRLTEHCAEWRMLLESGQLADRTDMSDLLLEGQDTGAAIPHPAHSERALHTMMHRARPGARYPLAKQEPSDEVNGVNSPIGEANKRRRRSPDLDSHQAGGPGADRRDKRRRYVSPEPKKRQTTSQANANVPSPEHLSPRNDGRLVGLDRRLSHALSLQLQHGIDITSLDSRLQSQSSQLSDMSTCVEKLQKTVSSSRAKISTLGEKVNTLGLEERVVEIDRQQLKMIAVEALDSDLRNQLDAQLNDLVNAAISRIDLGNRVQAAVSQIDIGGLVQTAVSRIPLNDLIQDAISRAPLENLIQGAVSRVMVDADITHRLEAIEQRLKNERHPRSSSPPLSQHRQQVVPSTPAQNSSHKAREELIIRTMAEKIEKLEAELGKARAIGPPATPSRTTQHQPGGSLFSPIKLENSS